MYSIVGLATRRMATSVGLKETRVVKTVGQGMCVGLQD
jgi:hypothetical protein